ncbi:hypothetical protein ACFQ1M_01975 [Sungkyunkwania multivorans]|uniref:Uncharacterized protein n=1 Tax=Sungkyunkwania multivorans TaxID=1173618 RepID=A0ABW3CT59_9FLAO
MKIITNFDQNKCPKHMDNLYTLLDKTFNSKFLKLIFLISGCTLFFHNTSYAQINAEETTQAADGDNDIIANQAGGDNDIIATSFAAFKQQQTLAVDNKDNRDVQRIEVYSLYGELVTTYTPTMGEATSGLFTLSLGAFSESTVVVKIFTEESVIVTKMTVE